MRLGVDTLPASTVAEVCVHRRVLPAWFVRRDYVWHDTDKQHHKGRTGDLAVLFPSAMKCGYPSRVNRVKGARWTNAALLARASIHQSNEQMSCDSGRVTVVV
jgi:hypothetical protein